VAEQLGFPVMQLHRVAIGTIQLGKLETGQYRALYPDEVAFLQSEVQQAKQQGLSAKEVAKQKEVTKQRVAPM
jgi:hypothetical protein